MDVRPCDKNIQLLLPQILLLFENFTAPIPDNSNLQEYISNVYYDIKTDYQITTEPPRTNMTKQEIQSLHQLKTDNDLLVKPADEGGAIVIGLRTLI